MDRAGLHDAGRRPAHRSPQGRDQGGLQPEPGDEARGRHREGARGAGSQGQPSLDDGRHGHQGRCWGREACEEDGGADPGGGHPALEEVRPGQEDRSLLGGGPESPLARSGARSGSAAAGHRVSRVKRIWLRNNLSTRNCWVIRALGSLEILWSE